MGHVFTSAMTGNLVLLGISIAHRDGQRVGRVAVSLCCFVAGTALGARMVRSPKPDDPVWPSAITRALAVEALAFVVYATCWWTIGVNHSVYAKAALLGLGAIALGIQSASMMILLKSLGCVRDLRLEQERFPAVRIELGRRWGVVDLDVARGLADRSGSATGARLLRLRRGLGAGSGRCNRRDGDRCRDGCGSE